MPRNIPIQLANNIRQDSTTLCTIMRVDPVQPGFTSYGAALLDVPVTYNDGTGAMVYQAIIGAQPSALVYGADLSVDGGSTLNLLPEFDFPISEADIVAGAYDLSTFTAYLIDYRDTAAGHIVLGHGTMGRFTVTNEGLSFVSEMRGLSQALKQTITEKWSLGCRATFGSRAIGDSGGDTIQERYPCNYDTESLWEPGTVVSVGLETNQNFYPTALNPPFGGEPGMVRWITGANAGRTYEVEALGSNGIELTFPTMFPIQIGDTFEFRDDCPKTESACKARNNWPNFRGEPNIPVADAGQITAPGASAGVGTGATNSQDFTDPV